MTINRFLLLITMATIALRLLPHPANVAPITALVILTAWWRPQRSRFILPLLAAFVTDAIIGFHDTMLWVYGSYALILGLTSAVRRWPTPKVLGTITVTSSILFFVITNFGVWLVSDMYPHTPAGFWECYLKALPFFRNTLIGDMFFVTLFGLLKQQFVKTSPHRLLFPSRLVNSVQH